MAQRTGVPTIVHVAHELCRLIVKFTPVIQRTFPDNEDVLAALAAANVACSALGVALEPLIVPGV